MKPTVLIPVLAVFALAACNRPGEEPSPRPVPVPKVSAAPQSSPAPRAGGEAPRLQRSSSDGALSDNVKRSLSSAPEVDAQGVEVVAADGVVTLFGTVQKPQEKHKAALIALSVDGVRSVVNNLVVVAGS